jgi:hypothetical protein
MAWLTSLWIGRGWVGQHNVWPASGTPIPILGGGGAEKPVKLKGLMRAESTESDSQAWRAEPVSIWHPRTLRSLHERGSGAGAPAAAHHHPPAKLRIRTPPSNKQTASRLGHSGSPTAGNPGAFSIAHSAALIPGGESGHDTGLREQRTSEEKALSLPGSSGTHGPDFWELQKDTKGRSQKEIRSRISTGRLIALVTPSLNLYFTGWAASTPLQN